MRADKVSKVADAKGLLTTINEQLSSLETYLKVSKPHPSKKDLLAKYDEQKQTLAAAREKYKGLCDKCKDADSKITATAKEFFELPEKLIKQERIEEITSNLRKLGPDIENLTSEIRGLGEEVNQHESEVEALIGVIKGDHISTNQERIGAMQLALGELDDQLNDVFGDTEQFQRDVAAFKNEVANSDGDEAKKALADRIFKDCGGYLGTLGEVDKERGAIMALVAEIKERISNIDPIESEVSDIEAIGAMIKDVNDRIAQSAGHGQRGAGWRRLKQTRVGRHALQRNPGGQAE